MASKAQAYVDRHHNWDDNVAKSLTIYQQVLAAGNLSTAARAQAISGGAKSAADVKSSIPEVM